MFVLKCIVFALVLAPAVFAALSAWTPEGPRRVWKLTRPARLIAAILVPIVVLVLLPCFGQVSAGHRGVVLRFGAVTERVLGEGVYFVTPLVNEVETMDVQVHALKTPAKAASRDLQDVTVELTVNYRLDPLAVQAVYQSLRQEYVERIISPSVQEVTKAATAAYDAEELIQKRASVRDNMEAALAAKLSKHGILVDQVSITNFQFSKDFTAAIESKVVATQNAQRAQNDLQRIQIEAKQRIATATAEAEAIRIQAEAITSHGGEQYVNLKAVEKWDGKLPQWTAGGALPFVNLSKRGPEAP